MSFYFESIGKKSAVAAAATNKRDMPDNIKSFLTSMLNNPTNDAIDSVVVSVQGHGGSCKVEIREFVPEAAPVLRTPVGYGDNGLSALSAEDAAAIEWTAGRRLAQANQPLPDAATEMAKEGYESWKKGTRGA